MRLTITNELGEARLSSAALTHMIHIAEASMTEIMLVITGQEDAFCEGIDFDELSLALKESPEAASRLFEKYSRLIEALDGVPCPIVALVRGRTIGGGVGIAAMADFVIAAPDAVFSLPETLFGLVPLIAARPIMRRIGMVRTRLLALGAAQYNAHQALAVGLVDEVSDNLEASLERYRRRLERMSLEAIYATKRSLRSEDDMTRPDLGILTELLKTETTQRRVTRFVDGDTPW